MKFEIERSQEMRKPVAKISEDGYILYLPGGVGIPADRHVALLNGKASVNGSFDVTHPLSSGKLRLLDDGAETEAYGRYIDVFEGDTVKITF